MYAFNWGSQKAISISNRASVVFVRSVSRMFIVLFRSLPKLTDWKSVVLVNTKRTMNLISRLIRRGIVIRRLRSVNIKLRLRSRNDGLV